MKLRRENPLSKRSIPPGWRTIILAMLVAITIEPSLAASPEPRHIESFVRKELAKTEIPGASIAIIRGGRIVWSGGIGVADKTSRRPVGPHTLFQAASISKAFTAVAALRLVETGQLRLDQDVNDVLQGWKLRDEAGNVAVGVSLRLLLSHTAGTSVSGFRGYDVGEPVPDLPQILDGLPPANNRSVRVITKPGTEWRYSGGGYVVLQRLIEQVTGQPLGPYLNQTLLAPLGMRESVFAQPLPAPLASRAAHGYLDDGTPVAGGSRTYPETAAAGLWTTAADLAKFVIAIRRSVNGRPGAVLTQKVAREALKEQRNQTGLGLFLQSNGSSLRFHHGGRNQGFDSELVGYANEGDGAIVMVNANDTSGMIDRTLQYIAEEYDWSDYPRRYQPNLAETPVGEWRHLFGHYEDSKGRLVTVAPVRGAIVLRRGVRHGAYYDRLGRVGDDLAGFDHAETYRIARDGSGLVSGLEREKHDDPNKVQYARIGGLAEHALPDPEPAITAKVLRVLRQLASKGRAADSGVLSPGFARDLDGSAVKELANTSQLRFAGMENTSGRPIERHDSRVANTRIYLLEGTHTSGAVLVYFDADGRICDYDLVDR